MTQHIPWLPDSFRRSNLNELNRDRKWERKIEREEEKMQKERKGEREINENKKAQNEQKKLNQENLPEIPKHVTDDIFVNN